ncbi:MAG: hypothetical protein M3P04_02820 [Actinomycetota bacterium]|nr:hypothetical protein [Actinomycetota bacterium]
MSRPIRARATAALLVLVALTGCGVDRLQFKNDDRLTFDSPKARHRVTAPLTVTWSMTDFTPTGLDGSRDKTHGVYAVFVDRAPMPVGKDLKWLFRSDNGCKHDSQCPTLQQLADRGVHVTTETSVVLDVLPQVGQGKGDEQHYVNIALLDGTGHRIGESAWYLPFKSKRRSV